MGQGLTKTNVSEARVASAGTRGCVIDPSSTEPTTAIAPSWSARIVVRRKSSSLPRERDDAPAEAWAYKPAGVA